MQNANQLFCKLYKILYESNISFKKRKSSATTNSTINNTTYLSIAIYFFIGNNKYNIGLNYSIHTNKVYTLVWKLKSHSLWAIVSHKRVMRSYQKR